jgi:hypothetical protein
VASAWCREDTAPASNTQRVRCHCLRFWFSVFATALCQGGRLIALTICVHAAMLCAGMFYPPGAEPRDSADRRKLGFVQVTARAGDCIIMPLRLCHAVLPWIPSERDRVVLFYNFIPQFYHVRAGCSLDCACATHDKNKRSLSSGTMCEVGMHEWSCAF